MTATDQAAPAPAAAPPKPKPKANPNAVLLLFRKYHTWFGVFAAGFVVMIAVTGIYLNHKDTFRSLLGVVKPDDEHHGPGGRPGLPTATELAALPVSFPQALEQAAPHLGDRAVERVELRAEHGRLVYKVKAVGGPEVVVDAATGGTEFKGGEKPEKGPDERPEKGRGPKPKGGEKPKPEKAEKPETALAAAAVVPAPPKGMDWGKAIKDLHTGKIAGDAGKLLIDLVALILIALTVSGLYLWAVPVLRKRRSARQRAAAATANAPA
jgi:uncharacterized iron-regulated membrane protein